MKKSRVVLCLLAVLSALPAGAEQFVYKYETGNKYRIFSVVNEDVYFDRVFSHRARIHNRTSIEVGEMDGEAARHKATYQSAEQIAGNNSFEWAQDYESSYVMDKLGRISIGAEYYMPMVRNVPVFPDRDLKEGETWTAGGYEIHDLRAAFGIEEPYRIPFEALYTFLGAKEWNGKSYPVFSVSYRIFYEPPQVTGRIWPRRIMGSSDQLVYWDTETGQEAAAEESFRLLIELSNGMTVEYRGRGESVVIESEIMNKEDTAKNIAEEIERLGIADASVRIVDEGITISLENIQFQPNSAILLESEKGKLDKIGAILLQFAGRDILVAGHTALSGTAAARQRLSVERAQSVSDYLISKKVRDPAHVVVRGYGSERPVADNRTAAGMQKNRRVEITLLEN
jgi:outer membrane protein OmpA-like peptidoglycan-associated protein